MPNNTSKFTIADKKHFMTNKIDAAGAGKKDFIVVKAGVLVRFYC